MGLMLTLLLLFLVTFGILSVRMYRLQGYQLVKTTEIIREFSYRKLHEIYQLVKHQRYLDRYHVGVITFKYNFRMYKSWALDWLHTYNIFIRILLYICFLYTSIFVIPCMLICCGVKSVYSYIHTVA